jgi:hypothetical protein
MLQLFITTIISKGPSTVLFIIITKCHSQVFSTPASHLGGPRFKSQRGDQIS